MTINPQFTVKNLNAFTNAYGLKPVSRRLLDEIGKGNNHVESVGILLRDPVTKEGLISCQCPVDRDVSGQMLWVPIDQRQLEAVPTCTRKAGNGSVIKSVWKRLKHKLSDENFYEIEEGNFTMRVHHFFVKQGVIESYMPAGEFGFIRRARSLYFKKKWCNLDCIEQGKEVSFIPIISRRGLQARAIEEVTS